MRLVGFADQRTYGCYSGWLRESYLRWTAPANSDKKLVKCEIEEVYLRKKEAQDSQCKKVEQMS